MKITAINVVSFKLMADIDWNKIPDKKKEAFQKKLTAVAKKMHSTDFTVPAHTGLMVKLKFYVVRMMQTGLGKQDPEYTDYKYWKANGWIDKVRPWR